jgi:hypothetical protein
VLHRRYGAGKPVAAVIRADGHVAAIGGIGSEEHLVHALDALTGPPGRAIHPSGDARRAELVSD